MYSWLELWWRMPGGYYGVFRSLLLDVGKGASAQTGSRGCGRARGVGAGSRIGNFVEVRKPSSMPVSESSAYSNALTEPSRLHTNMQKRCCVHEARPMAAKLGPQPGRRTPDSGATPSSDTRPDPPPVPAGHHGRALFPSFRGQIGHTPFTACISRHPHSARRTPVRQRPQSSPTRSGLHSDLDRGGGGGRQLPHGAGGGCY